MIVLFLACVDDPDDAPKDAAPDGETNIGGIGGDHGDGGGGDDDDVDNDFLFDGIQELAIEIDDRAMAGLATTPDQDADDVHADLVYEGDTWHMGLKLRGGENSFRTIDGKASFTLDFNQWDEDGEFFGLKKLALVNMVQDPSMLSEHLGYALYDAVGLQSSRHGYARVTVNGEPYGLYGIVEAVDGRFLKRRFTDDEGPLFEGENADLLTADLELFVAEPEEVATLQTLIGELDAAMTGDYLATLDARFGKDRALTHVAVDLVSGNADAYTTRVNNWFLYYEPGADQWSTMPWGLDRAFRTDLDVTSLYRGRIYQDCWANEACAARFREVVEDVLATWESMDLAGTAAELANTIHDDCVSDPRGPGGCDLDQPLLLDWIAERPDAVRAQLDEVAP
jgi:hypothetical protein